MLAAVVPILALFAVGLGVIADRRDDVRRAEGVAERVLLLDRLIDLRTALFAERVGVEILVPERRPPDAALATTDFGVLVLDGSRPLAAATDEALELVPPEHRPFDAAELAATRADQDLWGSSPDTIRARLGPLATRTEEVMAVSADEIRETAVELGDAELIAAGTTFQRAIRLPDAAAEVFGALSDLWAAPAEDRPALQSTVAAHLARYETLADIFAASLVEPEAPVAEFWHGPLQMPEPIRELLDQIHAGGLSGPERAPGEPESVGLALLEAIDWIIDGDRLRLLAADQLVEAASVVAGDARSTEQTTVILVALAVAVSIVGVLFFGRSIVLPLGRLTRQAERIGEGELSLPPLALRGPPDLAAASGAVNDVVGTLRLLDQKSRALADVDLGHPSLDEDLPGELGAALQRSTEVLSASVAERERLRAQLQHDATHDSLTGLANRPALLAALGRPALSPGSFVVFLDLDNFKQVRNRVGHHAADVLLKASAARLAVVAPPNSTVSRVGADQFVALVAVGEDGPEPAALAGRMLEALSAPIDLGDQVVSMQARAGVAVVEDPSSPLPGPSDLLQRADLAVSEAKRAEPGALVVYDEAFGRRVADESDVETALEAALAPEADELRVVFQPIVAASTGALVAIEALVRWERGGSLVSPADFVPIAERSGLVVPLDQWVLRTVTRQLAAWEDEPALAGIPASVNLSARTLLRSSLCDEVAAALDAHGVPPARLVLEVTETALVTDLAFAAARLDEVRRLGVRVALDDYGTGYTSIAQLRALPVDELKIDGSFVRGLPDPEDEVLIQLMTDVATHLGLQTVAEGVEHEAQAKVLAALGCDTLQGYHFARPMPADALVAWAAARSERV